MRICQSGLGGVNRQAFAHGEVPTNMFNERPSALIERGAMRLDDYYQTYRVISAYLAFLDQAAEAPSSPELHSPGDSVQF
jgi:hypothetical protein